MSQVIETEFGPWHTVRQHGSMIWCLCGKENCWGIRKYREILWEKRERREAVAHVVLPDKEQLIAEQWGYVSKMLAKSKETI